MEISSKKQIMMCIDRDSKRSDELCSKADEKRDFYLVYMANSLKGII